MISRKSSKQTPFFCFICGFYCDLEHNHPEKEERQWNESGYTKHFRPQEKETILN